VSGMRDAYKKAMDAIPATAAALGDVEPIDLERARVVSAFSLSPEVKIKKGTIVAEEFRALRTSLLTLYERKGMNSVVFTSCHHGEGKTSCVLNIGMALGRQRRLKVALVEGDLRRPKFGNRMGFNVEVGFDKVIIGEADLEDCLIYSETDNLYLLPARRGHSDAAEMVGTERMDMIMQRIRTTFDLVIIDSTPMLSTTEPLILGGLSDGILLMVKAGQTQSESVEHARAIIEQAGVPILGCLLSHVKNVLPRFLYRYQYYHDYYYYYTYGRTEGDEEE